MQFSRSSSRRMSCSHGFDTIHVVCIDLLSIVCIGLLPAEFLTVNTGLEHIHQKLNPKMSEKVNC